jgi:hypothetical protein
MPAVRRKDRIFRVTVASAHAEADFCLTIAGTGRASGAGATPLLTDAEKQLNLTLTPFSDFLGKRTENLRGQMRYGLCAAVMFAVALIAVASVNADTKPALRMEFQVQEGSLDQVMEILTRYAKREGFTLEDIGPHMPPKDNRSVFYVHLARQDSAEITVTNFLRHDHMLLAFYYAKQAAHPEKIIDPLLSELREKWPDIHVYTGL